jgi:hypothetical protein
MADIAALARYPLVRIESHDYYDISEEVTLPKLIAWLEARPDDYLLHEVSGRRCKGHPTGCLMDEYVNDLLGVTTTESGWINGVVLDPEGNFNVTWGSSPLGTRPVHQFDSLHIDNDWKPLTKAQVLELLRSLED